MLDCLGTIFFLLGFDIIEIFRLCIISHASGQNFEIENTIFCDALEFVKIINTKFSFTKEIDLEKFKFESSTNFWNE